MISDDYQTTALVYDRCLSPLFKPLQSDIRTFIFHSSHKRIIDICCGTGNQLHLLETPGITLVGVDNSISMLERARRKCSEKVELHLLDVEQDNFALEQFDCAIISFGLHEKHPANRQTIYLNARNLVRQGGTLILADFSQERVGFSGSFIGGALIPIIERCAGKTHYNNYLDWMRRGGLEGFIDRRQETADIISRPFGGSVICCAITINDQARSFNKHLALLNRALAP